MYVIYKYIEGRAKKKCCLLSGKADIPAGQVTSSHYPDGQGPSQVFCWRNHKNVNKDKHATAQECTVQLKKNVCCLFVCFGLLFLWLVVQNPGAITPGWGASVHQQADWMSNIWGDS